MHSKNIINNTIFFVQKELDTASGCHDWFHIERVWNNAKLISKTENVDLMVVELGALLHDIADAKFYDGDETIGPKKAREYLKNESVDEGVAEHVVKIIENVSFKNRNEQKFDSLELRVVQDADRLDAIGAIGIARTFGYGGYKGRIIYDPNIPPNLNMTKEEYKNSDAPTINHFYEKLLLLKDMMNTDSGKRIAQSRHEFMENYLVQFYAEWNGEK